MHRNQILCTLVAMHSISIYILIQQNEYRFIGILMYCCVLINELFSAMDKNQEFIIYHILGIVRE